MRVRPITPASQTSTVLLNENDTPYSLHKPAQGVSRNGFVVFFQDTRRTERALFAHVLRSHHSRDVTPRSASAGRCAASVTLLQSPAMSRRIDNRRGPLAQAGGTLVVTGASPSAETTSRAFEGSSVKLTPNADGNSGEDAEATFLGSGQGKVCVCLRLWKQGGSGSPFLFISHHHEEKETSQAEEMVSQANRRTNRLHDLHATGTQAA